MLSFIAANHQAVFQLAVLPYEDPDHDDWRVGDRPPSLQCAQHPSLSLCHLLPLDCIRAGGLHTPAKLAGVYIETSTYKD